MIRFWNAFTKITAWPVQFVLFRTRYAFEDRKVQGRRIHGPAVVVCNHTSVFDYAAMLFAFPFRTLRTQIAELQFRRPVLGRFLRMLGGIYVDRYGKDFGFIEKSEEILNRGGVVLVFPESRIPRPEEATPLEFKPSAAFLALSAGVPVIPVYTDGAYFCLKRTHVAIGCPMDLREGLDPDASDKENLASAAEAMRQRVIELGRLVHE